MKNIKIVSWNVNSIRKGIDKELEYLVKDKDPDVICFQETKGIESDIEKFYKGTEVIKVYPHRYYNDSVKGQAGVAVWSKIKAKSVLKEIPRLFQLKNGRILVLEYDNFVLLNTYVPNTGRDIAENHRNVWHNALIDWLPEQLEHRGIIWCGDLNVVSEPHLDTSHHKSRPKRNVPPGLKDFEKEHLDEYLELGLYDVFRHKSPDLVSFTWFSMRHTNVGWRLDYFLVSKQILDNVEEIIHGKKLGNLVSDHTWLMLKLIT